MPVIIILDRTSCWEGEQRSTDDWSQTWHRLCLATVGSAVCDL